MTVGYKDSGVVRLLPVRKQLPASYPTELPEAEQRHVVISEISSLTGGIVDRLEELVEIYESQGDGETVQ